MGAGHGAAESEARTGPALPRPSDQVLFAPAVILEGLPEAVVAASRDGRIVFVNALAEKQVGYAREELLGQPVQMLWAERVRERYVHNMELYFATDHRCGSHLRRGVGGGTGRSSSVR